MDLREIRAGNANRHPWEIARASAILSVIPKGQHDRIVDVGAGDLYFLERFRERYTGDVFAVDPGYMALEDAQGITLLKSLDQIPSSTMDIGFLMDVLEHEEQDGNLLAEATQKIKPGGLMIITVPAYPSIFSPHDQFLGHIRRYNRSRLRVLTMGIDVTLHECFSFFTLPLCIRILQIALSKVHLYRFKNEGVGSWHLSPSHWLTKLISSVLKTDFVVNRSLNRFGFPTFGLSLCMLLQKKSA